MLDFDFHNLLNPHEFEQLCRDVLEIREAPLKFITYRTGRDGGIDIKCTNSEEVIIGQVKLYNPNDFKNLKSTLKKEVEKCRELNPNRYILMINRVLSVGEENLILKLFDKYILNRYDLIDGETLNKLLNKDKYKSLLKSHSKLLVPNARVFEILLEKTINKRYWNKKRRFLKEIKKRHRLYHNTEILENCIKILEQNRIIILTGNPGVGKTTTAQMITQYMLSKKIRSLYFLEGNEWQDIENLFEYDERQLFIVDDFFGSQFVETTRNRDNLKHFVTVINDFIENDNHYLILTSRNYIIKKVLAKADLDVQKILMINQFIVDLNQFSNEDKARIFLNHLQFYDKARELFTSLEYGNTFERIINHSNYSPRHIEFFIKNAYQTNQFHIYNFHNQFIKYLDNPQSFWKEIFNIQSNTSKLILILLFISSDPIDINDLKKSFLSIQKLIRSELNLNINPLSFKEDLNSLEELFIRFEKQDFTSRIFIRFQSPGIKDFLLEYLREHIDIWGESLIKGAVYFNQLNFVFSTTQNEVDDFDSDISLFGNTIVLNQDLKDVLKSKILSEFHSLSFCTQEEKIFAGRFSNYNTSDEIKYLKLIILEDLFKVTEKNNTDVRQFIINEFLKDFRRYELRGDRIVDSRAMPEFVEVVNLVKPYIDINPNLIIEYYHNSIRFTSEYKSFYNFKEIYPSEFDNYISKHLDKIKEHIIDLIIDDAEYYLWEDLRLELDTHLYENIEYVCKKYSIELSEANFESIELIIEQKLYILGREREEQPKNEELVETIQNKKNYEDSPIQEIVKEYLYDEGNEIEEPVDFIEGFCKDEKLVNQLKNEYEKEESILTNFFYDRNNLLSIIDFLSLNKIDFENTNKYIFIEEFINYFFKYKNNQNSDIEILLTQLALDSLDRRKTFSITEIEKIIVDRKLDDIDIYDLHPIFIKEKNWYSFLNSDIIDYLIVKYLDSIESDAEYKKIVEDSCVEYTNIEFLKMLEASNYNKIHNIILYPYFKNLNSKINNESSKTITLSFVKYFNPELWLEWLKDKEAFELDADSGFDIFVVDFLKMIGLKHNITYIHMYFLADNETSIEWINDFKIDINYSKQLYQSVITQIIPKKERHFIEKNEFYCFEIKLFEFMSNGNNYEIFKRIGMEEYILSIYDKIVKYLNSFN